MRKIACLLTSLLFATAVSAAGDDVAVMRSMAQRLFAHRASSFVFRTLQGQKSDTYTIASEKGKIVISGNDANSMAVALNYYLKNCCRTTVSWYKDDPVELPKVLPVVKQKVSVQAKVPDRFFLNYCTFGYTMTWWKWSDWERFIDWMALNGINMPLAITGQEAVWYNVWSKLGLTDEEIRSFFTGPAYLPWQRMCNLDVWDGPLPKEWLSSQAKLQQQILARERELNMRPILPAFAGHIPAALLRLYPKLKATRVSEWGGFADKYRCTFLNPMDSLYAVIQKAFLTEQTRLFGTNHIYGVDPFNEVDPPSWDADSLASMSRHIYHSIAAVDPQAHWLQMTWLFYADSEHWNSSRIKAYLTAVPQDRLILLDYFCEYTEIWKKTESYFGQPFLWCYLGNFGGNTFLSGPVHHVSECLADVFKNSKSNFRGLGSTLEGLNVNQFMYEFVMDKAWDTGLSDSEWFARLADRRLGYQSAEARKAWALLADKVYIQPAQVGQGTLTNARPSMKGNGHWTTKPTVEYQLHDLVEAWRLLLEAGKNSHRNTYAFDVVNFGRQVLGDYFYSVRDAFAAAYEKKDVSNMQKEGAKMMSILTDIDKLVACHPSFSLHKWISDARDMGSDNAMKDYYERDARSLVTIWGDSFSLTDYANRSWADLTSQYYAVRWQRFITEAIAAVKAGKAFDEKAFLQESLSFENEWVTPQHPIIYHKGGDAITTARAIYRKYAGELP
jgi:alpha-N-acetylglucosaminidase